METSLKTSIILIALVLIVGILIVFVKPTSKKEEVVTPVVTEIPAQTNSVETVVPPMAEVPATVIAPEAVTVQ